MPALRLIAAENTHAALDSRPTLVDVVVETSRGSQARLAQAADLGHGLSCSFMVGICPQCGYLSEQELQAGGAWVWALPRRAIGWLSKVVEPCTWAGA